MAVAVLVGADGWSAACGFVVVTAPDGFNALGSCAMAGHGREPCNWGAVGGGRDGSGRVYSNWLMGP